LTLSSLLSGFPPCAFLLIPAALYLLLPLHHPRSNLYKEDSLPPEKHLSSSKRKSDKSSGGTPNITKKIKASSDPEFFTKILDSQVKKGVPTSPRSENPEFDISELSKRAPDFEISGSADTFSGHSESDRRVNRASSLESASEKISKFFSPASSPLSGSRRSMENERNVYGQRSPQRSPRGNNPKKTPGSEKNIPLKKSPQSSAETTEEKKYGDYEPPPLPDIAQPEYYEEEEGWRRARDKGKEKEGEGEKWTEEVGEYEGGKGGKDKKKEQVGGKGVTGKGDKGKEKERKEKSREREEKTPKNFKLSRKQYSAATATASAAAAAAALSPGGSLRSPMPAGKPHRSHPNFPLRDKKKIPKASIFFPVHPLL
jgi:hypothetical protein